MNLAGKKLLILGANPETVPLVQRAEELGVHTIVTDHVPGSYAKKFATESRDINGFDVDALATLVKEESIDGIMVGVADRLITPYQQLCQKVGLPCYATQEQCHILTNKLEFNSFIERHGLHGIPRYDVDQSSTREDLERIIFPVMVKPVDSNSGKGMSTCYNIDELIIGMEDALKHSHSQRFLVERYMTCDDIYIFYTFLDGICWASVIGDRSTFKTDDNPGAVCIGAIVPSQYTKLYLDQQHHRLSAMFQHMDMKNGVLMLSAFVENNQFYYYDPGFRLQGEQPNIIAKEILEFDHLEYLIRFALSSISDKQLQDADIYNTSWSMYSATIWILLKAGEIAEISGLDAIEKRSDVYNIIRRLSVGDMVQPDMIGTEGQVFARIYVKGNTPEILSQSIEEIQDVLNIYGPDGRSLISSKFQLK